MKANIIDMDSRSIDQLCLNDEIKLWIRIKAMEPGKMIRYGKFFQLSPALTPLRFTDIEQFFTFKNQN